MTRLLSLPTPLRPAAWLTLALTLSAVAALSVVRLPLPVAPGFYLLWHTALEFLSLAVIAMVVGMGWVLRASPGAAIVCVLGAGFFAVGVLDFLHVVSIDGMPDLVTPAGIEKTINFWLMARAIAAATFLGVALSLVRLRSWPELPRRRLALLYGAGLLLGVGGCLVGLYGAALLPRSFVPGSGLTSFKIGAEYAFFLAHGAAGLLLWRDARQQRNGDVAYLAAACWAFGLSGLFFTRYAAASDFFSFTGHIYKVLAGMLMYRALFVGSVNYPLRALATEKARVAELEERWQYAINSSQLGVWDWDVPGARVWFSEGWKTMLGYTPDEIGDALDEWSSRVHPDDLRAVMADVERHFAGTDAHYANRHRVRHKAGHYLWILDRGGVVARSADGKPLRMVGTHTDITPLIRMQEELATAATRERAVLQAMDEGVLVRDAQGLIIFVNPAAERILGLSARALVGSETISPHWVAIHEDGEIFPDEERPGRKTLRTGQMQRDVVMGLVRGHGGLVWLSLNSTPMRSEDGTLTGVVTTFTDISATRAARLALQANARALSEINRLYARLQKASDQAGILEATALSMAQLAPEGGAILLAPPPPEPGAAVPLRQTHQSLSWGKVTFDFSAIPVDCAACKTPGDTANHPLPCLARLPQDGWHCLPIDAGQRRVGALIVQTLLPLDLDLLRAVAETIGLTVAQQHLTWRLQHQSTHDALTGLFNRRYLDQTLPREFARAQRQGASFVVAMADLDHFKRFNDHHGHAAGDAALVRFADILRRLLRSEDLAARYGGEEFVVLLPDISAEVACERLQRIAQELAAEEVAGEHITVSFGVAAAPAHGTSAEALLRAADDAMYRAKAAGRNRIECAAAGGPLKRRHD